MYDAASRTVYAFGTTADSSGGGGAVEQGLRRRADGEQRRPLGHAVQQLERFEGNISKTAEFIGMERTALHRKLKSLDVRIPEKAGT